MIETFFFFSLKYPTFFTMTIKTLFENWQQMLDPLSVSGPKKCSEELSGNYL